MFRYVATIWNPSSEVQNGTAASIGNYMRMNAPSWRAVMQAPGLVVYCTGMSRGALDAIALPGGVGVVLGTLFDQVPDNDDIPHTAQPAAAQARRILTTEGRELTERYWGRYVAFLRNSADNTTFVIRSPTGELDCLGASLHGVKLYFSGTEDVPFLNLLVVSINWDYVASDLATMLPETRQTGLREVERLMHGECMMIRDDSATLRSYWNPIHYVRRPPLDDPTQAAVLLRKTTRACVCAWSSCYDGVLAFLSGGLDSSIICSLIGTAPGSPKVTTLNCRNPYDPITDERVYARLVAQRIDGLHVEAEQLANFSLRPLLELPKFAYPLAAYIEVGNFQRERELARMHGAGAYVLGIGGDQLFFQNGADYMCADYIRHYGLTPRLMRVALDAARMEAGALLPTLRRGIRDAWRENPLDVVFKRYGYSRMLNGEVTELVRKRRLFVPHWLDRDDPPPPGKCWQIIGLSMNFNLYSPFASSGDPPYILPLLSQPLQELCLQIPTHVLTFQARDRGLARRAFSNDLPDEITRRRTKSIVDGYSAAVLTENFSLVRDHILGGVLAQERLIDRATVESALAGDLSKDVHANLLLRLFSSEAWARSWTRSEARVAA